eukprot:1331969-Amorphochlora_amoeboformis.AAC.2
MPGLSDSIPGHFDAGGYIYMSRMLRTGRCLLQGATRMFSRVPESPSYLCFLSKKYSENLNQERAFAPRRYPSNCVRVRSPLSEAIAQ